jgi:hypothetical protein
MSCTFSAPLSDEQIIAALDNDIPPDIAAHLRDCPECRARFEVEQTLQGGLMERLFRVNCPPLDKLRDYSFRMVSADLQKTIELHLQQCGYCRQDIESMKDFSEMVTGQSDIPTPNPIASQSKWPLVPPAALVGRTAPLPMAALRGRGFINGVMLEATGVSIALEAEQNDDDSIVLSGQFIVSEDEMTRWNDALVELWHDGRLRRFTVVDDTGWFECPAESTGNIRLVIISRDEQVVMFNDIDFPKQYGTV